MVTSTAAGTGSPPRTGEPEVSSIEVVAVVTDQATTLTASIHRLHRALAVLLPAATAWSITIADHGSRDRTWRVGAVLARELPNVRVVRIPERIGRRALQRRWASSPAATVAFVTVEPDVDFDALVVPLARRSTTAPADRGPGVDPPPTPAAAARQVCAGRARRGALAALGGVGVAAVLAACGGSADQMSSSSTAATSATTAPVATSAGTAAVDDEVTTPYYVDLDLDAGGEA